MANNVFKFEVRLKRSGNTELVATSRAQDNSLIRSATLLANCETIGSFVKSHQDGVLTYQATEHKRAHELAVSAAELQQSEQAESE